MITKLFALVVGFFLSGLAFWAMTLIIPPGGGLGIEGGVSFAAAFAASFSAFFFALARSRSWRS